MRNSSFAIRHVSARYTTAVEAHSAQSFARHTHDEYGIGMVLVGAQRSWSGRGIVEAVAGDLITVNPGEVHDGAPIGKSRTWAMLYFAPNKVAAIVSDILEGNRVDMEFTDPVIRKRFAARRFAEVYSALINGHDEFADERLMLLVAGLLHDASVRIPASTPPLACIKMRIDADPAGDHPLEELAREVGASRFQTLRSFAGLTGLTPHAYVVQRRLDVARSMIRDGAALANAASAAGFADQSHFHRSFTRRYGLTPGAYAIAMR